MMYSTSSTIKINRDNRAEIDSISKKNAETSTANIEPTTFKQTEQDIFIEIEPKSNTPLVVKDVAKSDQQVDPSSAAQETSPVTSPGQFELQTETRESSGTNFDSEDPSSFPSTLTRLTTANGSEVFLLGSVHFSPKSMQDVQKIMRSVKPSAVVLELCKERAFMLTIDEESLLEQNRRLSFDKIKSAIAEKGVAQGLIFIMFIKMSANLTEKLGMAPGGEFRAGAAEAQKIPGCTVVLGDRSLRITVARAVASITLWQKIKLVYQLLTNDVSISQEDVERCKEKDILEQLLQELGGEFPGIKRTLLDERNYYLAHSIYHWAQNSGPQKVVAIVGVGHVAGIVEHWGKTTSEETALLNVLPTTSKTKKIVSKAIKYTCAALLFYVGYRIIIPSSIQAAVSNKIRLGESD